MAGELILPTNVAIQTGRLDWFRNKVRMALNLFATRWPAKAKAFAKHVKARKAQFSDPRCLAPDRETYFHGVIPREVRVLLDLPEMVTLRLFGVPCGTGSTVWQREDAMKDAFWSEASDLKITSYQGRAEEHKRRGPVDKVG